MSEENVVMNSTKPKGLSIAGMVLGIVGCVFSFTGCLFMLGIIVSLVGLVLSAVALKNCSDGKADGRGMAIAGLSTSIVGLCVAIYISAVAGQAIDELDEAFDDWEQTLEKSLDELDRLKSY